MKQILTTIIAVVLFQGANAQNLSIGARTGAGKMLDITALRQGSLHTTWEKELFLRYETKGRLAFEARGTQYNYREDNSDYYRSIIICFPNEEQVWYQSFSQIDNYNVVSAGLSAQYDITCKYMQECPLMKNLRSYIGLNTTLGYAFTTTTYTDRHVNDGSMKSEVIKNRYIQSINIGLNHTLKYTIDRLYISSVVFYGMQFMGYRNYSPYLDEGTPNSKLSLMLGIGYKIN